MLLFDQETQPARRSAYGPAGQDGTPSLIDDLAREIESTQRQQSEILANIVERLRVLRAAAPPSALPRRRHMLLDEAGDEPWDTNSAEQLMRSYETTALQPAARVQAQDQRDWFGSRLDDLTDKITRALQDVKPTGTVSLLEERLDTFQRQMSAALKDVVRLDDLEGLRLIEVHVNDLGDKLDELERHVTRIDSIESDVRNVMAQVSDERIGKLLDYNSRFTADLEAVARRTADEVQSRLAHRPDDGADAEARRHEELRALIEASITDRREAEAQATSLVTDLSGRVSAQADRYDALKGLLEQAIQEQRQSEQTAFSMLDTLQQALVTVLDRMDALELRQKRGPSQAADILAAVHEPVLGPPPLEAAYASEGSRIAEPNASAETAYGFRDTRFTSFGTNGVAEDDGMASDGSPLSEPASHVADAPESPIDRLRRDFVADARRAKLKAAANRAEEFGSHSQTGAGVNSFSEARSIVDETPRQALGTGSGRLFGMSTKLLASVLVLIIAINGGLLFFNRSSSPPAAPAIVPKTSEYLSDAPAPPSSAADGGAVQDYFDDAPRLGPRSEAAPDGALKEPSMAPYGFHDDVLTPSELAATDVAAPANAPRGMTIDAQGTTLPVATAAGIYEQQVLASLSGHLGQVAAGHPPSAFLPEQGGRMTAAYPAPELSPHDEGASTRSALELPPATVGPMSLRVAAANGDPSAEFEVAARLAEGKGTGQDYAEALRWYQRSAAKGFAQSQYRVGTLYERGLGVGKDIERAKIWYARAAENGNVKAMHNLAVLIAGEQSQPDYKAALPWFLKAAEHGLADSQYNLGVLLENGLGAKVDRVSAYKWYALAAEAGDPDAIGRRDALRGEFDAAALASADAMVTEFQPRRASPLANDARTAGEDWKKRVNNDTNI
ncbi:SEL1-like repeat protein [Hyphomicrobium sp. CS1GBMeth3]|uniref:SEL1-like repeat protein n=1 Tax=Hyphomicrobium sp. CS1GBMeth3 TaxID=1892845 RepID=UPI0009301BED|nr:SEL1-like repeat protein [Hyphomicrobium sp. CS1GBMeth3]